MSSANLRKRMEYQIQEHPMKNTVFLKKRAGKRERRLAKEVQDEPILSKSTMRTERAT